MKTLIQAFPDNLIEAQEIASQITFKVKEGSNIQNIVICGLGGSGIGGKIVSQWLEKDIQKPITLCQDYDIPAHVNENTLIIASSYSGNTEETLSSVQQGIEQNAQVIGICSGGKLKALCEKHNFQVVVVPGGNPPRTALAFSLVQLVKIFCDLGMAPVERLKSINSAKALLDEQADDIHRIAKEMAEKLGDKTPIFYAESRYEGVAVRAKQQLNENSKVLCWWHVVPEMNHNELVGWGGGSDQHFPIFLNSGDLSERNQRRWEISKERMLQKTSELYEVHAKGNNIIERSLYLINVIDWLSWYHADINGVDQIEIDIIDYLKSELSKI